MSVGEDTATPTIRMIKAQQYSVLVNLEIQLLSCGMCRFQRGK